MFEFLTLVFWQSVNVIKRICLYGLEAFFGCQAAVLTHWILLSPDTLNPIATSSYKTILYIPTSLRLTKEGREILLSITALSTGVLILSIPVQRLYNLIPVWYDDFTRWNFLRMVCISYASCGLSIYTYLLIRAVTLKGLPLLPEISETVGCELSSDVRRMFKDCVYKFLLPAMGIAWAILELRVRMIRTHRIG